ncbi:methyltransferase domain-containing protein [Chloroflexota bacterium]
MAAESAVAHYNSFAPEYDAWFDGEGQLIFATELNALEEILPALPRPWLEVGIGSGRFALALGVETGIDLSLKMAEIARSRGLKVILARGEKLPFPEGSFGVAFLLFTRCFVDSIAGRFAGGIPRSGSGRHGGGGGLERQSFR